MSPTRHREVALPGREAERELFLRELEAAAQGRPRMLLLEGEPGVGRSALLSEIESSPMLPGRMRVVRVDLPEHENADPVLHAARAASHYGLFEKLGGRRRVGRLARKLLPEWIGAIPGVGDVLEAVVATAEAVRKRRRSGQRAGRAAPEDVTALIGVARRRPLALLIDDLHRADENGVERVRRLVADAETGVRLLVVATCRAPRLGAARHAVHRLPERLPGDRIVHRRLEPVGPEPAEWRESPDADAAIELPAAVTAALRTAAALPPEFDALALAERLGEDELEVEDRLAMAVRAGALVNLGIADLGDGELSTRYRFASSALRARFHRSAAALADAAPAEP